MRHDLGMRASLHFVDKAAALKELCRCDSSFRNDVRAGTAPKWLPIGPRRAGLLRAELDALIAARAGGLSVEQQRAVVAELLEHRRALGQAVADAGSAS